MRRYAIDSSAIAAVGYDEASRTLELELVTGAVYDYDGVPPEEALALLEVESRGRPASHRHRRRARPRPLPRPPRRASPPSGAPTAQAGGGAIEAR